MNKTLYYEIFNSKCNEFIDDLVLSFPEFRDQFSSIKTGLSFISTLDIKTPCTIYKNHVLSKYGDAIINKNEDIFLKENKFYEYENQNDEKYWGSFIGSIKEIWTTLDKTNKDIIWDYFKLLNTISKMTIKPA
jgi:hypothetical protein